MHDRRHGPPARSAEEAATAATTPTTQATPTTEATEPTPRDGADLELLALIDRLADLLERSDLSELEVESGGTGLVLRKPPVLAAPAAAGTPGGGSGVSMAAAAGEPRLPDAIRPRRPDRR